MKLSYSDIISKNSKVVNKCLSIYKEESNVFAYYILKSVWLFYTDEFISWFNENNTFLIYSEKTTKYVKNILSMTKKYYNAKEFLDIIEKIEKVFFALKNNTSNTDVEQQYDILNTLQMSLF